jgi:hypothetical protein
MSGVTVRARWSGGGAGVNCGGAPASPPVCRLARRLEVRRHMASDAMAGAGARLVESRTHGVWRSATGCRDHSCAVTAGWMRGAAAKAASIGGQLRHVAFNDQLLLSIDAAQWAPVGGGAAFGSPALRASRNRRTTGVWATLGRIRHQRVSDPRVALWPGAGGWCAIRCAPLQRRRRRRGPDVVGGVRPNNAARGTRFDGRFWDSASRIVDVAPRRSRGDDAVSRYRCRLRFRSRARPASCVPTSRTVCVRLERADVRLAVAVTRR